MFSQDGKEVREFEPLLTLKLREIYQLLSPTSEKPELLKSRNLSFAISEKGFCEFCILLWFS
jgi:hypothetical protein